MLDMRCPDDFEPALAALPDRYRGIDLLLNNAGLAPPMSTLQDAEQDPLDVAIDTNVTGLVALTRTLLPGLIERKGAVINLCVGRGDLSLSRRRGLRRDQGLRPPILARPALRPAGTGVRVTSIEPGMVETEFTIVRTGGDQAASDALYANMDPMTADDIAETIWWVATLPPHLNINALELMPTNQSWAGFAVIAARVDGGTDGGPSARP